MKKWSINEMASEVINLIDKRSIINLGIGLPTSIPEVAPANKELIIHSENGVLGVKGRPEKKNISATLINAGKETISVIDGVSYFDSALSFGMIRGGHVDVTVLGAMEVDSSANLANWAIPGKKITGMGGAMDLVNGPKKVIVMSYHFSKNGKSKLVKDCELPLTGYNVVNFIVTDLGVFMPSPEKSKFKVIKLASENNRSVLQEDLYY